MALAVSLAMSDNVTRSAILATILLTLMMIFRRETIRRPRAIVAALIFVCTILLLHSCVVLGGAGYSRFSPEGAQRGAKLALMVLCLWAAAKLFFGSAKPSELARALGAFLPFARRPASFSHALVSLVTSGLLILPFCKNELVAVGTAARARGGLLGHWPDARVRRNIGRMVGVVLRNLWVGSDRISGLLASRGYAGPESWMRAGSSPSIGQAALLVVATAVTAAFMLL